MYIQSGQIKANKKDIEAIQVFLAHAKGDMEYGAGGTYTSLTEVGEEIDEKEYEKGKLGLENIEFMLEALCPKWPKH